MALGDMAGMSRCILEKEVTTSEEAELESHEAGAVQKNPDRYGSVC